MKEATPYLDSLVFFFFYPAELILMKRSFPGRSRLGVTSLAGRVAAVNTDSTGRDSGWLSSIHK